MEDRSLSGIGGEEFAEGHFFGSPQLDEQRVRLRRLCERLTGNHAVAEDLVQETFLVAWRQARDGRIPADWPPYLAGIARKLCLNWRSRRRSKESAAELPFDAVSFRSGKSQSDIDPLVSLLHAERSELIDRALSELGAPARHLLIAYYLDEQPLEEIASLLNLTQNATAVRLHRSRDALTRVLGGSLRGDAVAHGLLTPEKAGGWETTRLWCPRCGCRRLQGRFDTTASDNCYYALRCPQCDKGGGPPLGFTSDALPMAGADVLTGVKGYRAAFKRLHRWWDSYILQSLAARQAACVHCGQPTAVQTAWPLPNSSSLPGFLTDCIACGGTFFIGLGGMLFHSAEFRTFWQAHPRIHYAQEQPVRCDGRDATIVGFADRQSSARLEIVIARDDLRLLKTK